LPLSEKAEERSALGKLLKTQSEEAALRERARELLEADWALICSLARTGKLKDWVKDAELLTSIKDSVNSSRKSFRYVLPTQLVAKIADPLLDARCLQSQRGGRGAFDARSLAKHVIAEFDQENNSVLGGSEDPYVSNPLRVPELSQTYETKRRGKDKIAWRNLRFVSETVENRKDEEFARAVFRQVLTEIYRRLSLVRVIYPTPRRVSLAKTLRLIELFLQEQSGGDRLLALSSALFTVVGKKFGLYRQVKRGKITAADEPSGMLADLECADEQGRAVLVVEVKDRLLTLAQLRAKLRGIKERQISEMFFIAQGTVEGDEIDALVEREFTGGQNVYISDFLTLARTALSIVGENGRKDFLDEVRNQMETYGSEITHRRSWASLLESL
jgi:hypothetical protein